jgi:flagellar basal body-associated protein FliL
MKKLLIIVVVLLLAGGGRSSFSVERRRRPWRRNRRKKKLMIQERHYVRLDTITVTLFQDDAVAGLYTAALTLEIAHSSQRSVVSAASPRLRDAMLRDLHGLVERRKSLDIPLDTVKRRMRNTAIRELGTDVVVDLFVENVLRKDQLQKGG